MCPQVKSYRQYVHRKLSRNQTMLLRGTLQVIHSQLQQMQCLHTERIRDKCDKLTTNQPTSRKRSQLIIRPTKTATSNMAFGSVLPNIHFVRYATRRDIGHKSASLHNHSTPNSNRNNVTVPRKSMDQCARWYQM